MKLNKKMHKCSGADEITFIYVPERPLIITCSPGFSEESLPWDDSGILDKMLAILFSMTSAENAFSFAFSFSRVSILCSSFTFDDLTSCYTRNHGRTGDADELLTLRISINLKLSFLIISTNLA